MTCDRKTCPCKQKNIRQRNQSLKHVGLYFYFVSEKNDDRMHGCRYLCLWPYVRRGFLKKKLTELVIVCATPGHNFTRLHRPWFQHISCGRVHNPVKSATLRKHFAKILRLDKNSVLLPPPLYLLNCVENLHVCKGHVQQS